MLFLTLIACTANAVGNPDIEIGPEDAVPTRLELVTVRVCAVIAADSPASPNRLVFLYKTDRNGVDAQAELTAFDATPFRCGDAGLGLVPGSDETPVYFDYMPGIRSATISELRLYRSGEPWNEQGPYAVAVPSTQPFSDYVFHANTLAPLPSDPSTLYVGTP